MVDVNVVNESEYGIISKDTETVLDLSSVNRSRMSRDLGINVAHVSRILSGKSHPSLALARRIADYLKVTVEDFCKAIPNNQ